MKIKNMLWALTAVMLLSGCANKEAASSSPTSPEDIGYQEMDTAELSTTCGIFYKDFLKLGATDSETITAEHPDWTHDLTDSRESWESEGELDDMFAYSRDSAESMSYYTKTFSISATDIKRWLNIELNALDNLFNAVHVREDMEGVSWYYTWTTDLETARLQIYSTGVTGSYTGLISFVRSGPTSVDQVADMGGTFEE